MKKIAHPFSRLGWFILVLAGLALVSHPAEAARFGVPQDQAAREEITATDTTWVKIHDPDGTAIFVRELQAGDIYRVPDRTSLLIDTGNAKALSVSVDGKPGVSIAVPQASIVRRNVSLDPDRLGVKIAIDAPAPPPAAPQPVAFVQPPQITAPSTAMPPPSAVPAVVPPTPPVVARARVTVQSVPVQSVPVQSGPVQSGASQRGFTLSSAGPEESAIQIESGKGLVVQLHRAAATVFVSNPEIADIQVKSPSLIYLFGKAPGETSLYAADGADHVIMQAPIRVIHNLSRLRDTLTKMMPDEPITVDSVEGAIVLSGNVSSAAHADDARALADLFTHQGQSASQGSAPPAATSGQAGAAPAPGGGQAQQGGIVLNRLAVVAPNQVNLRVRVAEVNRGTLQSLGINWSHAGERLNFATSNATLLANQATQNMLQVGIPLGANNALSAELDAMAQEGLITTLAEPNLTAMSGQSASFLAGGEFPVPVAVNTNNGVPTITVDYKKFGVSVQFLPTILDRDHVGLRLMSEVSELSTQGAVQISGFTIPALTVRRAETSVELGSGSSFVIAGLLQNNAEHDVSKIPALGDIPVLGPLFRSDRFRRQETELVIIVTPYLVRPMAMAGASPADGLNRPNDLMRPLTGAPYRQGVAPRGGTVGAVDGRGLIGPAGFALE